MFQLDGERNIHRATARERVMTSPGCEPDESDADGSVAPPADWKPRISRVTRSPLEELMARVERFGQTVRVPDGLAAIIFSNYREEQVSANGIKFQFENQTYHFYTPDSPTCHPSMVGRKVGFVFNRHRLDVIYVLDDAGRHIDTVPSATHPKWFDEEMERELKNYRRVAAHTHEALKKAQRLTTEKHADRAKTNREKIQWANSVNLPGVRSDSVAAMPRADRLQAVMRATESRIDAFTEAGLRDLRRPRPDQEDESTPAERGSLAELL